MIVKLMNRIIWVILVLIHATINDIFHLSLSLSEGESAQLVLVLLSELGAERERERKAECAQIVAPAVQKLVLKVVSGELEWDCHV